MQDTIDVNRFSFDALNRIHSYDPYRRSREGCIPGPNDEELLNLISFSKHELTQYDALISQEHERITNLQAQILAFQQMISQTKDHIDELHDQKLVVERHVVQCKRLQSTCPIRSLPNELLCEIFLHYASTQALGLADGKVKFTANSARTLSRVCSRWRTLSISFPQLWSRVSWLNFGGRDTEKDMRALDHLLSRTREAAVQVKVFFARGFDINYARPLLQQGSRILPLCKSSSSVVQELVNAASMGFTFDRLETLQLRSFCERESANIDLSSVVPNVRVLKIIGPFDLSFHINWAGLTHVHFSDCPWTFALHALEQCDQLQSLKISTFNPRGSRMPRPVTLNHLKELVIHPDSVKTADCSDFLGVLTTPKLRILSINKESLSPLPLAALVQRSGCSISTLSVCSIGPCSLETCDIASRLTEYLKCMPNLKVLHWTMSGSHDSELPSILSPLHPSNSRLPWLQRLELTLEKTLFTESAFVELVQSRFESVSSGLESVSLVISKGVFEDAYWEPLKEMQDQGLRISVTDDLGCVRTRAEAKGSAC